MAFPADTQLSVPMPILHGSQLQPSIDADSMRLINPLLLFSLFTIRPLLAQDNFDQFVRELRSDAMAAGFESATLDSALGDLVINPRILELYRRQPEKRQSLQAYLKRRVSPERVRRGRQLLEQHQSVLDRVAESYAVQPRFIVALWGSESDFGANMGDFSVVRSLATLAYGSKRKDYFRRELLVALRILEAGHIQPHQMRGSWAGAMGQCQFMPWSFSRRAVDFDGDGRVDVWDSLPDIFASIANFLAKSGWHDDQTWGREVRAPAAFDWRLSGHDVRLHLPVWTRLGLRRADGGPLPMRPLWTSLVAPDGPNGRIFLVYENFRVLRKWNRSDHFALSVGLLTEGMR